MRGDTTAFRRRLLRWYYKNRRDLPWRVDQKRTKTPQTTAPDPYHVLVSETMLQQTQVATVIPYFHRFIETFPTLADLAAATEQEVLRLWQGLGYYSRARHLLGTAKIAVEQFGGKIPADVQDLLTLPGVGRYTAGAISSMAFGKKAPLLDGNVIRVLSRLDLRRDDPRKPDARHALWRRAEELLPEKCVGDFNSALMELGATICTPRAPRCVRCPVKLHCAALAAGVVEQIPPPPAPRTRPIERRWTLAIASGSGTPAGGSGTPARHPLYLIEQRPPRGRWANMWQFVTIEADDAQPTAELLSRLLGIKLTALRRIGALQHELTHRRYEFEIMTCRANSRAGKLPDRRRWVGLDGLSDYPLPRPHLQVAKMISSLIGR